jgi:hypothetical protein
MTASKIFDADDMSTVPITLSLRSFICYDRSPLCC